MSKNHTADGSTVQKPGIGQTIAAAILGFVAVKIATTIVVTLWRLVTREEPPQVDMDDVSVLKKAAWVGLIGAVTGAARQSARDLVKPSKEGAA